MKSDTAKIVMGVFALALLAGAANAQGVGGTGSGFGGGGGRHQHEKTADKTPPKPKVDDKAYKAALKQLPDKHYDAWHGVR